MPFNPDEYLKNATSAPLAQTGTFNPDDYIYHNKPVEPAKPVSIWKKLGVEVTPQDIARELETGHPFRAFGLSYAKAGQDVATIPYAFFNQMALDYPRKLLERKAKITVPLAENKLVRGASYAAGITGGFKNPLLNTFGGAKAFLSKPLLQKAGISGLQAMAYPTQGDFMGLPINPAEKPGQFLGGAAMGAVIPLAGKTLSFGVKQLKKLPGAPEWLASNVSDITDFSKLTLSRLGSKVFNPEYFADDYVGANFTPRFREHLLKQIETLGFGWKNTAQVAKFKLKEINAIASMGRETRKAFTTLMRQGLSAPDAAEQIIQGAGKNMEDVIVSHNKPIVINNFINSIKRNLLQEKWCLLDSKGNLIPNQVTSVPNSARDNLMGLYNFYKKPIGTAISYGQTRAGKVTKIVSSAKDWQVMKQSLERLFTGNPQDDRVIANTLRTLIQDAKSSGRGIPGYKNAAKLWHDAKTLEEIAVRLDQWTDPEKINSLFAGINADNAGNKYQLLKSVRSALPGNLFDDLASHYTAKNFEPNFYPSLSGLRKLGITELSKLYFSKYPSGVNPIQQFFNSAGTVAQKIQRAVQPAMRPISSAANAYGNLLSQPSFSPGTKAAVSGFVKKNPLATKLNKRGSFVPFEKLISSISKEVGVPLQGGQIPIKLPEPREGVTILAKPTDFYSSIERYFDSAKQNRFDAASFENIVNDPQKIKPIARELFDIDELVNQVKTKGSITKDEIIAYVNSKKPNVYPFIQDLQDLRISMPYGATQDFMNRRSGLKQLIQQERMNLKRAYSEYRQSMGKPNAQLQRFENISRRINTYGKALASALDRDIVKPLNDFMTKAHSRAYEITTRSNLPPPAGIISNEDMSFLNNYRRYFGDISEPFPKLSTVTFTNALGEEARVRLTVMASAFDEVALQSIGMPTKEAKTLIDRLEKYNKRYKSGFLKLIEKREDLSRDLKELNPKYRAKVLANTIRNYRKELSDVEASALNQMNRDVQNTKYASYLPQSVAEGGTFESLVMTPGFELSEDVRENPRWSEHLSHLLNPRTQRHFTKSYGDEAALGSVYSFTRGGKFDATFPGDSSAKPAVMAFEVQSDPMNLIGEDPTHVIPIPKIVESIKQHLESEKSITTDANLKKLVLDFKKMNRRLKRETGFGLMSQSEKYIMDIVTRDEQGKIRQSLSNVYKRLRNYREVKDMDWHSYSLLENRYRKAADILQKARDIVRDIKNGDMLAQELRKSMYIDSPYTRFKNNLYKELNAITLIKKAINTGVDRVVFTPPTMATMQWGDRALGWKRKGNEIFLYQKDLSPKSSELSKYLTNPMKQAKIDGKTFLYQPLEKDLSVTRNPLKFMTDKEYDYDRIIDILSDSFASSSWDKQRRKEYAVNLFKNMLSVDEGMIMPHYQRDYVLHETTSHENIQRMLNHFGIKMERVQTNIHPELGGKQESWGIRLNDSIKKAFKEGKIPFLTLLASMLPTLSGVLYDNVQPEE